VAVSDYLVGFYCPSSKYLFYYKKSEFLSATLTNPITKSLNGYPNTAAQHKGISCCVVTASLGDYSHFTLGTLSGSTVNSVHYYVRGYTPLFFAFNQGFFVDVVKYSSSTYWMIGILNSTYTTVNIKSRASPSGLAVRDITTNSLSRLYYTVLDSSTGGYKLYKEDADLSFKTSNENTVSVGLN